MSVKVVETLKSALVAQANGNSQTTAPIEAILWTDKECQWQSVIPYLQVLIPNLCVLGPFAPNSKSGPAIWLKCVIAGLVPDVKFVGVPVIYLPGIGRSDLRAIESCPRELQPLAELQFRGEFWSQANGKDWTINAFLTSKTGGLGLDVSQDRDTQHTLKQVLDAGVLLEKSVVELQGRQINAEWLNSLLAPNPTRDVLAWLNDPTSCQNQWVGARWDVFLKRCKSDFGFHPINDGIFVAAEKLAKREDAWSAVWELYCDSFTSFPNIYESLVKVKPPQVDLFDSSDKFEGYPQFNSLAEDSLRAKLYECLALTQDQASHLIIQLEKEHHQRRGWLWARMGLSPLAAALEHLCAVAQLVKQLPLGSNLNQLADSYQKYGWEVDFNSLKTLGIVQNKADIEAVSIAVRAVYLPWLEEAAVRFQKVVSNEGGLPQISYTQKFESKSGLCTVFVDGLRYDVARELQVLLSGYGQSDIEGYWTCMPSVTASGKAWCSPVANLISGNKSDVEFEPRTLVEQKPLNSYNFKKLLSDSGIQVLDKHSSGDPDGTAWIEYGDLDHYGHEHGVRLARDIHSQLKQIVDRISELIHAGWSDFRIVTDHGWLLMPGGLPKSELQKFQAETRWGRCAVLKEMAVGTPLTFSWSWSHEVQIAFAPGVTNFIAGAEYAHGGLSLQECLVPVVSLQTKNCRQSSQNVSIKNVTWKGLRCVVEIDSFDESLSVDIRTKPAQSSSSLVATVKTFETANASLAIADDENLGTAAVIVVIDVHGNVVQKQMTTIGG